jgi:hypothetical protein
MNHYVVPRVSIVPEKRQSVHIQFTIAESTDRTSVTDDDNFTIPGLSYSLYAGSDFDNDANAPIYRSTALALELGEHSYSADLRILPEHTQFVPTGRLEAVDRTHLFLQIIYPFGSR